MRARSPLDHKTSDKRDISNTRDQQSKDRRCFNKESRRLSSRDERYNSQEASSRDVNRKRSSCRDHHGRRSLSREWSPQRRKKDTYMCEKVEIKIEKKEVKDEQEKLKIEDVYIKTEEGEEDPHYHQLARSCRHQQQDDETNRNRQESEEDFNEIPEQPSPTQPLKPEEPNFEPSGLLVEETNLKNGVLVKYSEPPDARDPTERWRLYVFKPGDEKESKILHLYRSSCFLVGKEPRIAEVLLVHPSISKQHAAIQFRHRFGEVKPFIIDLESTNGTYLNGEKIEPSRYYELRNGDNLRFGRSSRDLILLSETSAESKELSYVEFANADVSKKRQELQEKEIE